MKLPVAPLSLAAVMLAGASVAGLQLADEHLSRPYDVVHVPDGRIARIASLGQAQLVSTLYWLATVQYIGEPRAAERGWGKLYPLVDLVTDLDPQDGYAYQTAGIVLSLANRFDESNRILRKGMEKGPSWWSFPFYVSFNYWFYQGDYAKGAEYALIAARTPGASSNIRQLALSLSSKSGTPEHALALLRELRSNVKDEVSAAALDQQVKLAMVERDAQALEGACARFRADRGRWPVDLEELVRERYVTAIPEDPFGGRYYRGPDGRVRSSANSFRFSVFDAPHAPGFQYKPPESELRRMPE